MRDLKPGDRVKITGPWGKSSSLGGEYVGKTAIVMGFHDSGTPMIKIYGWPECLYWLRENLRALPRRK